MNMKEASLHRAVSYSSAEFPPLPPRRRISATCWERVWWLTLTEPLVNQQGLNSMLQSISTKNLQAAAGLGIRIAIPYVHRLMLRIDYAWGLAKQKTHGISMGLNQFFQAYSPL